MLSMLFPPLCMLCDEPGDGLCAGCAARLLEPPDDPPPEGLDRIVALCAYDGAGRGLVLAIKRRNRRSGLGVLSAALAEALERDSSLSTTTTIGPSATDTWPVEVVTWAPTTASRRAQRGFDQSRALAAAIARQLGVPLRGALRRRSAALAGAALQERLTGVAFEPTVALAGHVLVVDDVVASGATMTGAAMALRDAGAERVTGAAIARVGHRSPGERGQAS